MGLNNFGESYNSLLGFGMMIVIEILKWEGQWPSSKYALAMLMIPFRHTLSLMMFLRCFYESLLGSGVDKLLHLAMESINSFSEKGAQDKDIILGILSKISVSIWWSWAILNDEWRVY